MGNEKLTVTVAEAAKLIGIDKHAVYCLCKTDDFPSITIGRRVLIPYTSLVNWLEQKATAQTGA